MALCVSVALPAALTHTEGANRNLDGMDELLLPSVEEEARSDHSSFAPGDAGRTMGDRLKTFLQDDLTRTVRKFLKRNGLLTLSVVAVLTGCTLGFMLRGTPLSTQVSSPHSPGD